MDDLAKKWELFINVFINKGGYNVVLDGLLNTLKIAVFGLVIGMIIGTLISMVKLLPQYKKSARIAGKVCNVYVAFFRGSPMVVQLLLGYYVILPLMGIRISSVIASIIVFGLNSGAYVSEIMRGGILSVDPGQMEAGRALGLSYWTTMFKIVVPQAIKNILPTLGNEFITLVKDTSIVGFVGANDLTCAFGYLASNNYEYIVPYVIMALIYIVIVLIFSGMIHIMEKKLRKDERHATIH